MSELGAAPTEPRLAPTTFAGITRQLGPGLILSAVIVGSGELIVTPKLGAAHGFTMLWFIVAGCLLKVFVQVELGRYAISRGTTTLEAFDRIPGPRLVVSWLVWLWLAMYAALVFQVAGMVGGLTDVVRLAGAPLSTRALAVLVGAVTAVLLVVGRYRFIESFSTALVALFTFCTVLAVVFLQRTPFAVTSGQLLDGLSFRLPEGFNTAFAAFGVIGVGASELIYYPYWCLEKGYGKSVGQNDGSAAWKERARGWMRVMNVDAWVSLVLYTTATLAFYVLGAAILHAKGLVVEDQRMIETLSHMYQETFGAWSRWLFLAGAFAVLYSTVFGATASNARLFADALSVYGIKSYATPKARARMVKVACVLLPVASTAVYLGFGAPVSLVFVGAIAQGLMLPFLAWAALHFRFRETEEALRPGLPWTVALFLSSLSMVAAGLYQVVAQVRPFLVR
jgi:Mn2+/Fe2+ NRAMP family transporter